LDKAYVLTKFGAVRLVHAPLRTLHQYRPLKPTGKIAMIIINAAIDSIQI